MCEAISEVIADEFCPIIVQFQCGEIEEGSHKNLEYGLFHDENKNETIAAVANKEILYTGPVKTSEELYNNFLLARNKKTGKVRLIKVDTAILSPRLNKKAKANDTLETTEAEDKSVDSSIHQLHKKFGSKKVKRMTEQRERLQMDISNVKEQLEQTVANIEIDENDVLTSTKVEDTETSYKPLINREASTKEEVYELSSLIPMKLLKTLADEASDALGSELEEEEFCPFVKQHLLNLQDAVDNKQAEKAMILLYVNYLVQFLLKPAKMISPRSIICKSSPQINQYIIENFSLPSNNGRTRPLSMKDKLICHILVLLMLALDYQVDIAGLSKDTKIGVKKIQDLGRVLAFTVQGKDKNVMILKLPLPAPIVNTARKRKR